jgi:non-lysosomal glucosylceramidase
MNRRKFVVTTSAAVIGAATPRSASGTAAPEIDAPTPPRAFRSPAGSVIPYARQELVRGGPQRTFTGPNLSEIAFPLGGIGTGTVSLGGRGQLVDWEIFNRPAKGQVLPFTFAALWVKEQGGEAAIRVLEAPPGPPYRGSFGYSREQGQGMPHLQGAKFTGAYPFARVDFDTGALPVDVTLEAFNPFVPLSVDDSSLPLAVLHYRVSNRGRKPVEAAVAFSLYNAVGYGEKRHEQWSGLGKNVNKVRTEQLAPNRRATGLDLTSEKYAPDHPRFGSMCVMTSHPNATARARWEGGEWFDAYTRWADEFAASGGFQDPPPGEPSPDHSSQPGTLAPRFRLGPGASETVTFVLAWYFPNRENYWNTEKEVAGSKVRNDYATRFGSAWEVGRYALANLDRLESASRSFHEAFFTSSLPAHVLDAVSSQASIIRTNTCMLLEGKQFFAFEGCGDEGGCCPMNCTHVWNYEQALAFLFPELERSMRVTDFKHNMRDDGAMAFRTLLPVGRAQWKFKAAADGQMGTVMKLYREWQMSGDDAFLRELWPQAKRALEYAWVAWDADRDGVMDGEQHNTYDIEFFGPNTMVGTLYLGALKAGEAMALSVGEKDAAESYRRARESGERKLEALWNGDYYVQKVPAVERARELERTDPGMAKAIKDGRIRYQYGDGCLSDQLLGQWFADVVGLGHLLTPERVGKTLESVYRFNFKHSFYDHPNPQRIYALNDERGLLLCSWPKGGRPELPFVYSDEVWTGIEYQVAAHLVYRGYVDEGLAVVKAVRDRYDGGRRNPWNEVECGAHYARALASWSVLLALSGFRYSAPERRIAFGPRLNSSDFRCFFSAGTGWGVYRQLAGARSLTARLETKHGETRVRHIRLSNGARWAGVAIASGVGPTGAKLNAKATVGDSTLDVDLGEDVVVGAGQAVEVRLVPTRRPSAS